LKHNIEAVKFCNFCRHKNISYKKEDDLTECGQFLKNNLNNSPCMAIKSTLEGINKVIAE